MLLRKLKTFKQIIFHTVNAQRATHQLFVQDKIESLRKSSRHQNPKSLIPFGYKVYSASDEDGIIREIFNRIGVTNKIFVECGIGDGLENNTLALLFDNWKGLWIDSSTKSINNIKEHFSETIRNGYLTVVESPVTTTNINELISSNINHEEIDLLSIDIDGNDYHVFNAMVCVSPRVVVIEYNAKFRPPTLFCMDYDKSHVWKGDDCFGVSLKFLEVELDKRDYCLVGCNLAGTNAFFIRKDLVEGKFLGPFSAENHYEPARYYLCTLFSGHPPSYRTLARSLTMRPS